jgi:hypothetical protein
MNDKQPWYVAERALALASLMLTSRKDVVVRPPMGGADDGIDILAEIRRGKAAGGRFFGVQVIGRAELPGLAEIRKRFRAERKKTHAEYTMPVCAFLFDVRTNAGYYRWLVEPVTSDDDAALNGKQDSEWAPLNEKAANQIVDRVGEWYETLALQLQS